MEQLAIDTILGAALLAFIPIFHKFSPASKSAKVWTTIWLSLAALYSFYPVTAKTFLSSAQTFITEKPYQAAVIGLSIGIPLKYIQNKLRFARLNELKWKYGFTDDPKTYEDMSVEVAQEIERNMAEWEFPRLWQFGWISDFFRTSTDPGVSKAITASGHFINEDKRVEHQRMQATVHLMTGLAAYPVKSKNSSLVISRINEHHHRYGIKINSDDVLYLITHFGLAPVPWINKFGYRKLEPFEVQAIWTLWRELGCRMGVKYIPKTLSQAAEWRKNFENTHRWREPANKVMALAMLSQVLYPVPTKCGKDFVAKVVASIVDWDIVYFCQMECLGPSPVLREVVYDIFRLASFVVRHFMFPRLSPYVRSPAEPNKEGRMNFPHTPYDTMPYWQADTFWNLWGPRAIWNTVILGMPRPSKEFESQGVPFEAMGAPHPHPGTQANIEKKVRENAMILEDAPYGYRPPIGFQANRLIEPVSGPEYGEDMNRFPEGTPTTPNNPIRFTREYERRGGVFSKIETMEKPEDVEIRPDQKDVLPKKTTNAAPKINGAANGVPFAPLVSAAA